MKKLGFLTLALSLSVYSLGCGGSTPAPAPSTPATPAADSTDATAAPADGAAAPADGAAEADHEHADGEAHTEGESK